MGQSTGTFGYALNTLSASGADIVAADGRVTFTGTPVQSFLYENIINPVVIQAYVVGVARVQTATVTAPAAVGETYSITIEQPQVNGGTFRQVVSLASSVGDTANTVAAKLDSAINSLITVGLIDGTATVLTNAVTTTGTLTAPMLRLVGSTSNIALAVSVAGTVPINSGADLAENFPNITNLVATNNYATVRFDVKNEGAAVNNEGGTTSYVYAVNNADGNLAAFLTKAAEIFGGLVPGNTTANPEVIAKS